MIILQKDLAQKVYEFIETTPKLTNFKEVLDEQYIKNICENNDTKNFKTLIILN